MIEKFENLLKWISLKKGRSFANFDKLKINFSQKDTYRKMFRRDSVIQAIYNNFISRVLRTKRT